MLFDSNVAQVKPDSWKLNKIEKVSILKENVLCNMENKKLVILTSKIQTIHVKDCQEPVQIAY